MELAKEKLPNSLLDHTTLHRTRYFSVFLELLKTYFDLFRKTASKWITLLVFLR